MSNPQEIIVYRNPAEAAFWHSMMNGGFTVFVMFACIMLVSFLILFFGITKITGKGNLRGHGGDWILGTSLVLSFLIACFSVWKFA